MLPSVAFSLLPPRLVRARLPLFLLVVAAMLVGAGSRLFAAPPPPVVFTGWQTQPFGGSGKGIAVDSSITGSARVPHVNDGPVSLTISQVEGEAPSGGIVTVNVGLEDVVVSAFYLTAGTEVAITSSNPAFSPSEAVYGGPSTGSGTVTISADFKVGGVYTITASDVGFPSLVSPSVNVIAVPGAVGPPAFFVVTAPSSASGGSPINFTVTAYDAGGNVSTGYGGTVVFTSSDPNAILPGSATLSNGTGTFSATLETVGNQTITATDTVTNSITGTSGNISVSAPGLVVNQSGDDAGTASNCVLQPTSATTTYADTCYLRDALLQATTTSPVIITFDSTVFATAQTITLQNGALTIPSNTTINGATTGSGATLTNLVTVSGNNSTTVFTINKGVVAAINNLIIDDGNVVGAGGTPHFVPVTGRDSRNAAPRPDSHATGGVDSVHRDAQAPVVAEGGGIFNDGTLTISGSTISGNSVSNTGGNEAVGAGIFNGGTLTLTGTTVSGNTAAGTSGSQPYGGGIYNASTLTLINSTIAGNQAAGGGLGTGGGIYSTPNAILTATNTTVAANTADGDGGGIYHPPATKPVPTLANTVVAGNTEGDSQDLDGGYTDNGGNQVGGTILLAALGNFGGPTQTMLPLPDSAAICGGTLANATAASITADQRGLVFDPLCPAGQNLVDAGAVQASYALTFKVPPPPNAIVGVPFSAKVHLTESGQAANAPTSAIAMSDLDSALGGTTSANLNLGSATFTNLVFSSAVSGDTLTATLPLNSSVAPPVTVTAQSSAINSYAAATLTSPKPASMLPGPSVTFTWSPGTGAIAYQLWVGSTGVNSQDLYSSGATTNTSASVNNLPIGGGTIYVRLYTEFSGGWVHLDYTYTAATAPGLTSPTPTSVLAGSGVTFSWSPGIGVTAYQLWVGSTGVNSQDIYSSGATTNSSATVNNLPVSGGTIYVRLYAEFSGGWVHSDYTYTAATAAAITSPTASSTLAGPSVTFNWSAGTGTAYQLWVGSTGVNSQNIYSSGAITSTSATVDSLLTNSGTIYVRLYTELNGIWVHADYTYTAASAPAITSPTPGSTLAGPSVTFTWSGGGGATAYQLWLGSTGVNSQDLYSSGPTTGNSVTAPNLPTNGETIYARLYVLINGFWNHEDYTFTAASAPALASPAPGSTLTGSSATFTWSPGSGVTAYKLRVGSTGVNSNDLYSSAAITATSVNVTTLPTNGETIYVRLYMEIDGVWNREDYTYTAYTAVP